MTVVATDLPAPPFLGTSLALRRSERQSLVRVQGLVGTTVVYRPEQEIFGAGGEARSIFRVMSGAVRSADILRDGRRQIEGFHLIGDLFGFEPGSVYRQSAEAIAETRLTVYPRCDLEAAAQRDIHLALELWTLARTHVQRQQDHVRLLGRRSALERVAAFLADLERRSGVAGWFALPMTHRDIADYLGLTVETVARVLALLEAEGALIKGDSRRIRLRHAGIGPILGD